MIAHADNITVRFGRNKIQLSDNMAIEPEELYGVVGANSFIV